MLSRSSSEQAISTDLITSINIAIQGFALSFIPKARGGKRFYLRIQSVRQSVHTTNYLNKILLEIEASVVVLKVEKETQYYDVMRATGILMHRRLAKKNERFKFMPVVFGRNNILMIWEKTCGCLTGAIGSDIFTYTL